MQLELLQYDYPLEIRASSKARRVRIEVRPDGSVLLVHPRRARRAEALAFLHARDGWVRAKLHSLAGRSAQGPRPLAWDGSDRMVLRGVELSLRVQPATLARIAVRFEPQAIAVYANAAQRADHAQLARSLRKALIAQARADAQAYMAQAAAGIGVQPGRLQINDPRTQWGSCNPGGTICLSWRLLLAPPDVFRYVVIHELCHLLQRNHSPRFWALVQQHCPDFAQHKRWLRTQGAQLHIGL